jgi:hypothetical protein
MDNSKNNNDQPNEQKLFGDLNESIVDIIKETADFLRENAFDNLTGISNKNKIDDDFSYELAIKKKLESLARKLLDTKPAEIAASPIESKVLNFNSLARDGNYSNNDDDNNISSVELETERKTKNKNKYLFYARPVV